MSIGSTLREAREQRGLSVEDVAAATRIRSTLVRGIEADDFRLCGGAVYARGHIRSIGHVLGVDPEPLVTDFDRDHGGPPGGPVALEVQPFDPNVDLARGRRPPNWSAAAAVALLVIIAFAAYSLASGGRKPPPVAAGSTSPAASHASTPAPAVTAPAPGPSAVAVLPPSGVSVTIRVLSDKTWLSVKNSAGAITYQGLMAAGQQQSWTDAQRLCLVIGNAPVVDLIVNHVELGKPPSSGNVARLCYGPGNPTTQQTAAG